MPLSFENDTAFHEAGHTLITYLNSDFFAINYVTVDPSVSKEIDPRSEGGIRAQLLKEPSLLSLMEHDKLCICSLAGLAADDVNHADGKVISNGDTLGNWITKLAWHKYSGDLYLFKRHLHIINLRLSIDHRTYLKHCQELLYDLFTQDQIMPALTALKEILDSKQSVSGEQINALLDTTALLDWKFERWNTIFISRQQKMYPLATR